MASGTTQPADLSRLWRRVLFAIYIGSILVVSAQKGFLRADNNFSIFRAAFGNLVSGRDLYAPHPLLYLDLFKYSPTFAVLFAPVAVLPLPLAILLWSALNAMLLWYAVSRMLPGDGGTLALALLYLEVLRSLQRAQSNALIAALVLLAFVALEEQRQLRAAAAIGIGAFVKIFPLAAAVLAVMHPRRARFGALLVGVLLLLAALPLVFVSPHTLLAQYHSWWHLEQIDAAASGGTGGGGLYGGVMEQLRMWLHVSWPNWPVELAGTLIFMVPIAVRRNEWGDQDLRVRALCSLLVYMVIFNPQSESPSFVIAVTGIVIWYVWAKPTAWHTTVLVLTLLLVSLSSTEIVPHVWQREIFVQYKLKTLPCVLAWLVMEAELLWPRRPQSAKGAEVHQLDVTAP